MFLILGLTWKQNNMTNLITFAIITSPVAIAASVYIIDAINTAKTPEKWRI